RSNVISSFYYFYILHLHLHSFPTRRSSDLPNVTEETLFKPSKGLVIPRYHSTPLTSKRGNFYSYLSQVSFEYDFAETNRIIDTRSEEHTSELQSRFDLV